MTFYLVKIIIIANSIENHSLMANVSTHIVIYWFPNQINSCSFLIYRESHIQVAMAFWSDLLWRSYCPFWQNISSKRLYAQLLKTLHACFLLDCIWKVTSLQQFGCIIFAGVISLFDIEDCHCNSSYFLNMHALCLPYGRLIDWSVFNVNFTIRLYA